MKTKIVATILILTLLATVLCSCTTLPTVYTLNYLASEGGTVAGETAQNVEEGKDGEAVIAIANDGYEFVGWSDGVTTPIRQETNVSRSITVTAQFERSTLLPEPSLPTAKYTVQYLCNEGGSLQGQVKQTVEKGQDATPVTAIADEGYEFVSWSDDVTTATRQDKKIKSNLTVTAIFKKIEDPIPLFKTFKINYNFGETDEDKLEEITLVENETIGITLPYLTREHFTFHGWYCGDLQVVDTNGNLLLGEEELLILDGDEIYAKFTANETFTYKILLAYVTRIKAVLPHKDPSVTEKVNIDYTMSAQEREFCQLTTARTKKFLDKMMGGLVDFQVEEYYIEQTITASDFHTTVGDIHRSDLYLVEIAEVQDMLPQYDSALILYNATRDIAISSGQAGAKYGAVMLDSFFYGLKWYNSNLQQVIELMRNDDDLLLWENVYLIDAYLIDTIVHELAHTIEQRMNLYSYHNTQFGTDLPIVRQGRYYLHEMVMDGVKVGIPYEFWKGDIAKCTYLVTEDEMGSQGGISINRLGIYTDPVGSSNLLFDALYGEYVTVTAIPDSGYKFVQWSDGVTTAERTDLITGDFTVTAIFEEIK